MPINLDKKTRLLPANFCRVQFTGILAFALSQYGPPPCNHRQLIRTRRVFCQPLLHSRKEK